MKFVIPNILFVIFIGLLTIWLTFLTTKGSLTNNRHKNLIKRLTKRGKIVIFVLMVITALLVGQEINNKNLIHNQELDLKNERNDRDRKITEGIKKGVEDSRKELFEDVSKAFAKQGLKIDTLNESVEILKNRKSITNVLPTDKDPILRVQMAGKGIRLEGEPPTHFNLDFRCDDAGATNFNLKTYVFIILNNGQYLLEESSLFEKDTKFSSTSLAMMPISKTVKDVKYLFFYITGSYSNLSMTKNYTIDEVYRYQSDTKKTWGVIKEEKQKVIKEIYKLSKKAK